MSRKNGGIIGPANTPTGGLAGVASGVWRMNDLLNYKKNNQWPVTATAVTNSLRFDDGSSDYLTQTQGAGNRRTFTISCWLKRSTLGTHQMFFNVYPDASNDFQFAFLSGDTLEVIEETSGSATWRLTTDRLFRDVGAWYHIVLAVDTTQSTSSDRAKIYVNGVQETSFSTETYPSLNYDNEVNNSLELRLSSRGDNSKHFDGYMAEVVFIDGLQLDASYFGETNSTTNIWVPKPIGAQVGSFGTNGFYLDFADSSSLGNDVSGNDNDFTVNNLTSLDQVTDIPTNNFATLNSLSSRSNNGTFSEGNTKFVGTMDGDWTVGTMAATAGKWYWEVKANEANYLMLGITTTDIISDNPTGSLSGDGFMGFRNTDKFYNFGTLVTSSYSFSDNDIFSFMLDLDAGDCEFYQNDTLKQTITLPTDKGDTWIPIIGDTYDVTDGNYNINFGNPSVAISSGNSDPDGHGNFEYTTKTGYAWNTTNLNTYG